MLQLTRIQMHHNDTRLILVRDVSLAYRTQDLSERFFSVYSNYLLLDYLELGVTYGSFYHYSNV
ncbi:hypothetical protein CEV33_4694 [Brucella grignonensis]|uniref:Uncharacterized protein n=1 Tax=Brucella grignonensis TaxID=94627 RepID=A0A256G8A5_9HYPH|nr:hypothetical protein CEV33_4694 [Brucella grignonensis]